MLRPLVFALTFSALPLQASPWMQEIVQAQIQPAFATLSVQAQDLEHVTRTQCLDNPPAVQSAYGRAFDAWISASHWRFGPTETDMRAFSLAFWPDNRGKTPKAVMALLRAANPTTLTPDEFAQHSIAAKGFYALDFLLFDPRAESAATLAFRCNVAAAIATEIAQTTQAIRDEWHGAFAAQMHAPTARYASADDATQDLFKALTTGLQINDDMRLARPLGSFDRPRPKRAEAWRSGRSLRHLVLSLKGLKPLALALAQDAPEIHHQLQTQFDHALARAAALEDPVFAGVVDPQKRLRIEALKQTISDLRVTVATQLGPHLGVSAGFNSLDGD